MNRILLTAGLLATLTSCGMVDTNETPSAVEARSEQTMDLGNFSISLAVKDLSASRAFYENLGFSAIGGEATQNWLILRNGHAIVGLFQGMFENNIMTFNPGWDADGKNVESFTDIRDLQKQLKASGVALIMEADESTTGPASVTLADPDGNVILLDQHR